MESCSVGHITGSHMTSIPSEHAIIISSLAQAFLFPKKHRSSCLDRTGNSEALSDASWQEGCKGSHITSARPPPTNLSPTRFISPCQRRKAHPTESIIMRVWSYASILGLLTSKTSCVKMASHSQRWPIKDSTQQNWFPIWFLWFGTKFNWDSLFAGMWLLHFS